MRLAALGARNDVPDEAAVTTALLAHLCRCTGWQTIVEAARRSTGPTRPGRAADVSRTAPA